MVDKQILQQYLTAKGYAKQHIDLAADLLEMLDDVQSLKTNEESALVVKGFCADFARAERV